MGSYPSPYSEHETSLTSLTASRSPNFRSNLFSCWSSSTSHSTSRVSQSVPIESSMPSSVTDSNSLNVSSFKAVDGEDSSEFDLYNSNPLTNELVCEPVEKHGPPLNPTIKNSISAPTRKRKRTSGAMRMRNFLCIYPRCGKSFTDSAHLRDHTVVHTGEKTFSCPTCYKKFARVSTLQEHIRTHTGEKPYVCSIPGCTKRYSSRAALRFHRSTHNLQPVDQMRPQDLNAERVQSMPFKCKECGKRFRVRELLMAHMKVHSVHCAPTAVTLLPSVSTPRTENCKSLNDKEKRRNVHWKHGDEVGLSHESRFLYDTIRAQQKQIEQLKAEVLRLRGISDDMTGLHSPSQTSQTIGIVLPAITAPIEYLRDGVKPFECCICHNRFANFYQLTFHGKQHPERSMNEVTGDQTPLPVGPKHCPETQCEYAESTGRSLRNLQTLKRHWQRRHQNERPYTCSYCPATRQKTFKTRDNLKAHEKDCTKNRHV
ncbi:putative Zinc finger C2H2-type [Plasmopara halstedii]